MGLRALDREGTGHADLFLVLVGLVVEIFKLGFGGDGGVDLLLPGDAGLPPVGMQFLRGIWPLVIGLPRNFPFVPFFLERRVQLIRAAAPASPATSPRSHQSPHCWRWIERDVRHALIDEAVSNVSVHGLRTWRVAADFRFLESGLHANRPADRTDTVRP